MSPDGTQDFPLARHFAELLSRLGATVEVQDFAAILMTRVADGHSCMTLEAALLAPEARASLDGSPVLGAPGDFRPLILDGHRLYLYRFWQYETRLAAALLKRAADLPEVDEERLGAGLLRHFPLPAGDQGVGLGDQRLAAAVAVLRRLAVISGGPGTGKTTTVLGVLALLLEQDPLRPPRIALAAPTGKAATRLADALRAGRQRLDLPPLLAGAIPDEAQTLHRLLGYHPERGFAYDADHPLPVDVVVVDEASMVGLALMEALLRALPAHARLILLGDRDQLASVEAGAVLAEICAAPAGPRPAFAARLSALTGLPVSGAGEGPLADCMVHLRHSYRFAAGGSIGRLARALQQGDAGAALGILEAEAIWQPLPAEQGLASALVEVVRAGWKEYFRALQREVEPARIHAAWERFRLLSALRQGPWGAEVLNAVLDARLARAPRRGEHYHGRPVIIRQNDGALGLFNGDVGLTLAGAGQLRVFFPGREGFRAFAPERLPAHESAWVMTVHQSQGSEFDDILLLLPDADNPVLSRELLYTAVTRARQGVRLWGTEAALRGALARRMARDSGLEARLWSSP